MRSIASCWASVVARPKAMAWQKVHCLSIVATDVVSSRIDGKPAAAAPVDRRVEQMRENLAMSEATMAKKPRPKRRNFFRMVMTDRRPPEIVFENKEALQQRWRLLLRGSKGGFPSLPETARYFIDPPPAYDFQEVGGYWLVTDRMKRVLEDVDADAFCFTACDVRLAKGKPSSLYWLCDVMRVLDALDEAKSRVEIYMDEFNKKSYSLLVPDGARLIFRDDAVGSTHIFRMAHYEDAIICDDVLKDACKTAGLQGIRFYAGQIARS